MIASCVFFSLTISLSIVSMPISSLFFFSNIYIVMAYIGK